ncbi:MAG: hypothetical protein V3U45_03815 [bacterium]
MNTETLPVEPEVLPAEEVVEARTIVSDEAPEPELDPVDPEDGEEEDDEPDDGEDVCYSAIHITGHVTYHFDSREPWQVEADWKNAKAFPILPNSGKGPSLSKEEWTYLEELKKEDPKRFARKDAKVHAFSLGDRVFNPEHLLSVGPALDMIQPSEDDILGPDDGDQDPPLPVVPPAPERRAGSGRDRLRAQLGGLGGRN